MTSNDLILVLYNDDEGINSHSSITKRRKGEIFRPYKVGIVEGIRMR